MEIYKVKSGDSLSNISKQYHTTVDEIVKANNLPYKERLAIGMNLLIPSHSSNLPYFLYEIKPGDNLYSLSKKYKLLTKDIININNLTAPYVLYPGKLIKLPKIYSKNTIKTLPFFQPKQNYESYYEYIREIADTLTYIAIFDVRVQADASLIDDIPSNFANWVKDVNISPLPVISNFDGNNFNSDLARETLNNNSSTLIKNIVDLTIKHNLNGIILDFEHLYPQDRHIYNNFVMTLSHKLHENNKILGIAMAPKWEDLSDKPWVGFIDYRTLGKYIDIAYIMSYEWGWVGGDPQPIAPIPNIEKVITYALNNIANNKVYMGISLYGYDWIINSTKKQSAQTLTLEKAYKLAIDNNATILWNNKSKTPYFRYTDKDNTYHEVHFEDALSQYYKHNLGKKLNLEGFGYWVLNTKIAPTWYLLKDMFNIKKVK